MAVEEKLVIGEIEGRREGSLLHGDVQAAGLPGATAALAVTVDGCLAAAVELEGVGLDEGGAGAIRALAAVEGQRAGALLLEEFRKGRAAGGSGAERPQHEDGGKDECGQKLFHDCSFLPSGRYSQGNKGKDCWLA